MWEYHGLIDFPIAELLDDSLSLTVLVRHLHPGGLHGPPAGALRGGCAVIKATFRPAAAGPARATSPC
jgi:hypothetical protein